MSHQFTYWISPEECSSFEQLLLSVEPSRLIAEQSPSDRVVEVEPGEGTPGTLHWLKACLVQEDSIDQVVLVPVPPRATWRIDGFPSPIIEITRPSGESGSTPGRLYYGSGFWTAEKIWEPRSEAFLSWAARVFKVGKGVLRRDPQSGDWFSERGEVNLNRAKAQSQRNTASSKKAGGNNGA